MDKVCAGRWKVEYSDGRVALEALRFLVVHSSQLAQQQTQAYTAAQAKEAEAHQLRTSSKCKPGGLRVRRMPQRHPGVYGPGAGTAGTPPTPLAVSHAPLWRRGRDASHNDAPVGGVRKAGSTADGVGYRLVVEVEALANAEEDNGGRCWPPRSTLRSGP